MAHREGWAPGGGVRSSEGGLLAVLSLSQGVRESKSGGQKEPSEEGRDEEGTVMGEGWRGGNSAFRRPRVAASSGHSVLLNSPKRSQAQPSSSAQTRAKTSQCDQGPDGGRIK